MGIIEALNLEPHPEGGYFRRTYTSPIPVDTEGGERPAATMIHFWLPAGDASAWHVVTSDEIWLWHGPGQLALQFGGSGEQPVDGETVILGAPVSDGLATENMQQVWVPAGVWQRTIPGEEDCLVSCMVSPGFSFADFKLAD